MKKVITLFAVLYCLNISKSIAQGQDTTQSTSHRQADANLIFLKARKQKTAAWILLGAGAGLGTTGLIIGSSSTSFDDNKLSTGAFLIITGGIAMVGSIPFFISSGSNKRRAELMLKNESSSSLRIVSNRRNFIALSVKMPL